MDNINLMGSEDVLRAGHSMCSAAEAMRQVSMNIEGSLERHQRFLDDWLMRFEQVVDKLKEE